MEIFYNDTGLESEVIEMLPSHESGFYEVRFRGSNYKVRKAAFLKALVHCGFSVTE